VMADIHNRVQTFTVSKQAPSYSSLGCAVLIVNSMEYVSSMHQFKFVLALSKL
jgi:hypothetical protein